VSQPTTICFATDIYGSERCFMRFIDSARRSGAHVLILSGNVTGKELIPIVREASGLRYHATVHGQQEALESREELAAFEQRMRDDGAYPFVTTQEELVALEADRDLADALLGRLTIERVRCWCGIAEERLRRAGVRCFISAGDSDKPEIAKVLHKASYVEMPEGRVALIDDDHEMISCGFASEAVRSAPRGLPDAELGALIGSMASRLRWPEQAIFNIHTPPFVSGLDIAGAGVMHGPVGSRAVRMAIERYQPLVSLHGHIRNSPEISTIGRTTCLGPHSACGAGTLRAALVALKGNKLISHTWVVD
jgi:Icc-related predicted phosphoesterase